MLPSEAAHSSLDLFDRTPLLVTFDDSFCQKIGPVYSPNGPMLEFEVTGDRNNFIDLQKIIFGSEMQSGEIRRFKPRLRCSRPRRC